MNCLLVTKNSQKLLLLKRIIKELLPTLELYSLYDFPDLVLPEKNPHLSKKEQALELAQRASQLTGMLAIAEKWQMTISALSKEEQIAIFTADIPLLKKRKKILEMLQDKQNPDQRSSYLESFVAFSYPDAKSKVCSGCIEGTISLVDKGSNSTDFDSIFIKYDYVKTLAELDLSVRSKISHRRKALDKLFLSLEAACTT